MATKKACASDSWPVTPTRSVSPIAPIAADIANRPVWSQKLSAYCGSHSRNSTSAAGTSIVRRRSDTGDLPRAEEPRGPPQEHREQDDVRNHLGQPAAEERDLVLVPGREGRRDADRQPSPHRAGRRVEPAEHGGGDRGQRKQPRGVVDARRRKARE